MSSKTVLITGCSSGIGFETALAFARAGYKTFATMRNLEKKSNLENIARKENLDISFIQIDVTDENSIKNGISDVLKTTDRIDVLINNAGYGLIGSIEDSTFDEIKSQMDTDYMGPIRMIKSLVPIMRNQNEGK